MQSVVVVGGGISGLVAAWHVVTHSPGISVTVLEASDRVGGKLRQETIGGHRVDVGAESALWRRPEVVKLLEEIDADTVHPVRYPALLWSRGKLEGLPPGTLMGIPSEPKSALGLLTAEEVARAEDERPVAIDGDISVGDAVEQAVGSAVVDRMVEPLLGGVYAGHARQLSAQACVPALYEALVRGERLTHVAARNSSAVSSKDEREVFGAPAGGMGSLPEKLAAALQARGVTIRTGATVTSLTRSLGHRASWHVEADIDGLPEPIEATGVILATNAPVTANLLNDLAPQTAQQLNAIPYASMALATYAFRADELPQLPEGTGFLVPPIDGRTIKASTFSSVKWPWLVEAAPEMRYVRVSFGRDGEEEILQRSDEELLRLGLADLNAALGVTLPEPADAHVQRWTNGLPQYRVGHTEQMAVATQPLIQLPALDIAGAYRDGVGIPACVATARAAAQSVLDDLNERSVN